MREDPWGRVGGALITWAAPACWTGVGREGFSFMVCTSLDLAPLFEALQMFAVGLGSLLPFSALYGIA